jgi:hypothetical protein
VPLDKAALSPFVGRLSREIRHWDGTVCLERGGSGQAEAF